MDTKIAHIIFLLEALCNRFLFFVIYLPYLFIYLAVCLWACWFHSQSYFNWTFFHLLWFTLAVLEYWALTISETLVEWALVFNNYIEYKIQQNS